MAKCAQCGVDIIFGGVRVEDLRFCGRPCHQRYTEWMENLREAFKSYQESLRQLRQSPTNPQLKQKALESGRSYSAWTRRGKAVTVFDEVALANDIAAACAAAPQPPSTPAKEALTLEQRLERLQALQQRGLISDQEYASKRSEILAEL